MLRILEGPMQVDDKGAVHHHEEVALPAEILAHALLHDVAFGEPLHGEQLVAGGVSHKEDVAESALPKEADFPQLLGLYGVGAAEAPQLLGLAELLDVNLHARQDLILPLDGVEPGKKGQDDLTVKGEARQPLWPSVYIVVGHTDAAQLLPEQRALTKMGSPAKLSQDPRLHLAAWRNLSVVRQHGRAPVDDIPLRSLPRLALMDDALARAELDPHACV
mmetsp:Transcript_88681/g.287120  ORF Transcript_88681/g.287120 Transcript_88681/m.287120 type:complete len:219 (+) Transcript_88681:937-1593(+)